MTARHASLLAALALSAAGCTVGPDYQRPPPADPPLPSRTLLACLRATAAILENCPNKHLYQSYEVRGERGERQRGEGLSES